MARADVAPIRLFLVEDQSKVCAADGKSRSDIWVYSSTGLVMVALKAGNVRAYPVAIGESGYIGAALKAAQIEVLPLSPH